MIEKLLAEPDDREIRFSMYTEYLVLTDSDGNSIGTYYLTRPVDWKYIMNELTAAGEVWSISE